MEFFQNVFTEFVEFSESSAPLRKNSAKMFSLNSLNSVKVLLPLGKNSAKMFSLNSLNSVKVLLPLGKTQLSPATGSGSGFTTFSQNFRTRLNLSWSAKDPLLAFVGIFLFIISEWPPLCDGLFWSLYGEFKVTGHLTVLSWCNYP